MRPLFGAPSTLRHIFLCCDQPKPNSCEKACSFEFWAYLQQRLAELSLSDQGGILRAKANCLRVCDGDSVAVVYPEGPWYGGTPVVLERITQAHLVASRLVIGYLISKEFA